jgi:hypothetical protein
LILEDEIEKRKIEVIDAVKVLFSQGLNMSLANVEKYTGITRIYMRRHRILQDTVIKTKESLLFVE